MEVFLSAAEAACQVKDWRPDSDDCKSFKRALCDALSTYSPDGFGDCFEDVIEKGESNRVNGEVALIELVADARYRRFCHLRDGACRGLVALMGACADDVSVTAEQRELNASGVWKFLRSDGDRAVMARVKLLVEGPARLLGN